MSNTAALLSPAAFERTLADLKQGAAKAAAAHAKATEDAVTAAKSVAAFSQDSFSAFVAANQMLAAGSQDLLKQAAAASVETVNQALAGWSALAAAKTFREQVEVQSGLARAFADRALAESTRFAQAGLALAEKAAAPVVARAVLAAETFAPKV
jgi:hypothetical protein